MELDRPEIASLGAELSGPAFEATVRDLSARLGLRTLTTRLLVRRGVLDEEGAKRFLEPRLSLLRAPEAEHQLMAGFSRSVERVARAVLDGELIGLFGDYDVDGVTSCALLARFLRGCGGKVLARVASRSAGYGFSVEMADLFADAGCRLVVTGDCGTSDHEALARARERGIDVVIVDHHQVPDRHPECYALLNPHQLSCRYPFKGLASVGVAFYLAAAVRTRLRAAVAAKGAEALQATLAAIPDPRDLLDLVALGTVADLVPLTDENRVLVAAGLRELARARHPGTRALLEVAGLMGEDSNRPEGPAFRSLPRVLTAMDIGFKLAPLLNAPGRLGEAQTSLDLLLADDEASARKLALACYEINLERRTIQDGVYEEACRQIDGDPASASALVTLAVGEGWHPGVVGIVAAKLVDRYGRPAIVIGLDGNGGRGSARSPAGALNLYLALHACAPHLIRYGGHAAAAGLSIDRSSLPAFRLELEQAARALGADRPRAGRIAADAEVGLDEIDEALIAELALLGPFGMGNPEPLLVAARVQVDRSRVVGERHLQVTLRQGPYARDGIGFNLAADDPGAGAWVRASFVPELDTWRGVRRLRLRVRHLDKADLEILDDAELPSRSHAGISVEQVT